MKTKHTTLTGLSAHSEQELELRKKVEALLINYEFSSTHQLAIDKFIFLIQSEREKVLEEVHAILRHYCVSRDGEECKCGESFDKLAKLAQKEESK